MNPYLRLGSGVGTDAAASLCARLTAWHDAMVVHERRLRAPRTTDACHDECPHGEARTLWAEALATFGAHARELTFQSTPTRVERTLFVNLRSFAGAAALSFLVPVVVLVIGVPLALAVRLVLEMLTWLLRSTG